MEGTLLRPSTTVLGHLPLDNRAGPGPPPDGRDGARPGLWRQHRRTLISSPRIAYLRGAALPDPLQHSCERVYFEGGFGGCFSWQLQKEPFLPWTLTIGRWCTPQM